MEISRRGVLGAIGASLIGSTTIAAREMDENVEDFLYFLEYNTLVSARHGEIIGIDSIDFSENSDKIVSTGGSGFYYQSDVFYETSTIMDTYSIDEHIASNTLGFDGTAVIHSPRKEILGELGISSSGSVSIPWMFLDDDYITPEDEYYIGSSSFSSDGGSSMSHSPHYDEEYTAHYDYNPSVSGVTMSAESGRLQGMTTKATFTDEWGDVNYQGEDVWFIGNYSTFPSNTAEHWDGLYPQDEVIMGLANNPNGGTYAFLDNGEVWDRTSNSDATLLTEIDIQYPNEWVTNVTHMSYEIREDNNGGIWFIVGDDVYFTWDDSISPTHILHESINDFDVTTNNKIWVGTDDGAYKYDHRGEQEARLTGHEIRAIGASLETDPVTGKVLDSNTLAPIEDAIIQARGTLTQTDENGNFDLGFESSTSVEVTVGRHDYEEKKTQIFPGGDTIRLDRLSLTYDPGSLHPMTLEGTDTGVTPY